MLLSIHSPWLSLTLFNITTWIDDLGLIFQGIVHKKESLTHKMLGELSQSSQRQKLRHWWQMTNSSIMKPQYHFVYVNYFIVDNGNLSTSSSDSHLYQLHWNFHLCANLGSRFLNSNQVCQQSLKWQILQEPWSKSITTKQNLQEANTGVPPKPQINIGSALRWMGRTGC